VDYNSLGYYNTRQKFAREIESPSSSTFRTIIDTPRRPTREPLAVKSRAKREIAFSPLASLFGIVDPLASGSTEAVLFILKVT